MTGNSSAFSTRAFDVFMASKNIMYTLGMATPCHHHRAYKNIVGQTALNPE